MKAEKNPVSADLAALSMTCEGGCRGISGICRDGRSEEEKGGASELTNRLSHIRMTCKDN